MLKNPCDRIAAKVVAAEIRNLLSEPEEDSREWSPLAPVVQIMRLHRKDVERVRKRLEEIADRLDRDAELPARIVEWRKAIET